MSKKLTRKTTKQSPVPGYSFVSKADEVSEYLLKSNGLRVLYVNRPDTGVVTTNITYLVGARDEERGETGLAHMLEHMLFKPTTFDMKAGIKSGRGMQFERETGCILNANTWKDRTTYYFSYPAKYLKDALQIEAERMVGVVLTDKVLTPEQGNVLSEFDMYNGDPHSALSVQMQSTAFLSHPYGHETIGYREDIEDYNAEKLERFYRNYYRPDNAIMMVIGDVDLKTALIAVKKQFGHIKAPAIPIPRFSIREPKQEGLRRVSVERPSATNIVSIGFKASAFPLEGWYTTSVLLDILTGGPESVLHKLLIDTGKASSVEGSIEPSSEVNLPSINVTLAPNQSHSEIEKLVISAVTSLTSNSVSDLVKKSKIRMLTDELFGKANSLHIAQELTEYVSAGEWETYTQTPIILKSISTKKILDHAAKSFTSTNMTIGYFIGKE
ncbi:MAG: insulinase family protein [Candidatus Pacebacteria bacterium]|nr:insulinase family protein [Candidatus Paceibacterota bacterium]